MSVTISENTGGNIGHLKNMWNEIVLALEPLVDTLPTEYRGFFNSPVKLLIGNKISLAIIPPNHMWSYIKQINLIYRYIKNFRYHMSIDLIMTEISEFLSRLGLSMSINGKFLLEGPMSQQTQRQHQTAEYIGPQQLENVNR